MIDSNDSGGGIRLTHLTKSFGDVRAVRDVSLSIAPGETVALLGPNGAGKSTTIEMVLGLTRPDSGSVSLFGLPPAEAIAAGAVGGMLQTGSLTQQLTVAELISMTASLYPHPLEVADVLRLTGTAEFAHRRSTKLSGGQTQRVRFAISMVGNPDLLLLDEPTVALDVEGRRVFWDAIRAVAAQGKTVVFATHYLEEADAYADRIVLMAHGEIVADGPATEIKAMAGGRTIRATLPGADGADLARLAALPGVTSADQHGDTVILSATEPEAALRALLNEFPAARDVEVRGAQLEEAFLALTTGERDETEGAAR
ncbi:MAG TPA: ABC transporter ATP-binding protein [Streptosporangiaceae bacterium]|nr:ABC transporter ATP-binding protein [Streptosporangiaceae bacterium]